VDVLPLFKILGFTQTWSLNLVDIQTAGQRIPNPELSIQVFLLHRYVSRLNDVIRGVCFEGSKARVGGVCQAKHTRVCVENMHVDATELSDGASCAHYKAEGMPPQI
jgi:hypothetical protein